MSSIISLITILDFLGPQPSLYTFSQARYKSLFGGILSLIVLILLSSFSAYFTFQVFTRKNYQVIQSSELSPSLMYDFKKFPIIFTAVNLALTPIIDPRIINFDYRHLAVSVTKGNTTLNKVNAVLCNISDFEQEAQMYFKNYPFLNVSFCIDWNDAFFSKDHYIKGKMGDTDRDWSTLGLGINMCVNGTSSVICASQEEISSLIGSFFLQVVYLDYNLIHSNQTNPGQPFRNSLLYWISTTMFKSYTMNIKKIIYETDYGFVFNDIRQEYYHGYLAPYEQVDNKPFQGFPGNFASFNIYNYSIQDYHQRRYLKIQDLLANIGGIIKGIMFFSMFIEQVIVKKFYFNKLCSQFFYEGEEDNYDSNFKPFVINKTSQSNLSHISLKQNTKLEGISNFKFNPNKEFWKDESKEKKIIFQQTGKLRKRKGRFHVSDLFLICLKNEKITKVEKYVKRKLSIENIVHYTNEINKIKFILFTDKEISLMKSIQKPLVDVKSENNSLIQKLWNNFNFPDSNYLKLKTIESSDINYQTPFTEKIMKLW
jgi:hypothetical protein